MKDIRLVETCLTAAPWVFAAWLAAYFASCLYLPVVALVTGEVV